MHWYDYAEIVVGGLLVWMIGLLVLVMIRRWPSKQEDGPAAGLVRCSLYKEGLPEAVEVITFGAGVSDEQVSNYIQGRRLRAATKAEVELFHAQYPDINLDVSRRFLMVRP